MKCTECEQEIQPGEEYRVILGSSIHEKCIAISIFEITAEKKIYEEEME